MSQFLEKVSISSVKFEEICKMIEKSYPYSCILWIDQVNNDNLRINFEKYKSTLSSSHEELVLFHGTSESSALIIIEQGFDCKKNVTSAYGKGSYFATTASYSKTYMKPCHDEISFMLVCNVLVDKKCKGSYGLVIDQTKYDTAVDNLQKPSIYVVPNNNAVYPSYLVAFHKNAR